MRSKHLIAITAMAFSSMVCAQMPVPLLDSDAVANPAQWKAAAPIVQAALECRQHINLDDPALRPVFPSNKAGQWELVPPQGFAVFGLPVQSITIHIDPTGKLGASYSAALAAPIAAAVKAAKINGRRKTNIGILEAEQGSRPSLTSITCTVDGTREIAE